MFIRPTCECGNEGLVYSIFRSGENAPSQVKVFEGITLLYEQLKEKFGEPGVVEEDTGASPQKRGAPTIGPGALTPSPNIHFHMISHCTWRVATRVAFLFAVAQ